MKKSIELIWIASVNYECVFIFDKDGNYVILNKDGYALDEGHFSSSELDSHILSGIFRKYRVSRKVFVGLFYHDIITFITCARAWVNRVLGTKWYVPTERDVIVNRKIDQQVWSDIVDSYIKDMERDD